jgi:cytochrome P450/NADPH-cytochrome P450 reductase
MDEACDEKRFVKSTNSSLDQVRNGIGDGLFTAYHGEENWALAHRILMPAFGPLATKHMFEGSWMMR